ncbi:hypothetical protein [Streptomyces macrosporus]|uniref:Uncharacterized protein n=1 Tax=Streptomyces macrosporus TaxID=44032 RepID=A0ABN3KE73_9ACTN
MSDFFEAGRLYQHPDEGVFLVAYVGTAPEPFEYHSETLGVAFGWRRGLSPNGVVEGLGSYTTPDFHGWEPIDNPSAEPSGCRWCGVEEREHMQRWKSSVGWHQWAAPTDEQRKARMLARRGE